jgi:hypothetical protein
LQSTKNKKKIWEQIAKSVSSDTTLKVTGEQARERFYTIKRSYSKYLTESKKTGNGRPKIFLLETEMADILQNDPTFKPICTRDSLPISGIVVKEEEERETEETNQKTPPAKKKKNNNMEDIKKMLQKRDEKLFRNACTKSGSLRFSQFSGC